MEYKGYSILAHVTVSETWEFRPNENKDNEEPIFTSMVDRSDPLTENIEEYIVYDPFGLLLDQEFSKLSAAKKYIDELKEAR